MLRAEAIQYTWQDRSGRTTAVAEFNGDFAAGVPHILCGPTGSGKSTLAFLLAGLLNPESGTVTLDGVNVAEIRGHIATVFQFPEELFFEDSVEEELRSAAHGRTDFGASCCAALGVALDEVAQVHPFHLSAGYGRMVALALQLAREPRVLIADEPTIGLDWIHRARVVHTLKEWPGPERTLIAITHDLGLMRELGGRSWVLSQGRLVWNGDTAQLLKDEKRLREYGLA